MMSSKGKKLFLILSVVIPFLIYCIVYYRPIIQNAAFQEKDFVSLEYQWGVGEQLENSYNSLTGDFNFVDRDDMKVHRNFKLTQRDIKFLDSICDVQGFWNLPDIIANNEADATDSRMLRYHIKFNYKKKSKEVTYFPNFKGNDKMKQAIATVQKEIELTILDKEAQLSK